MIATRRETDDEQGMVARQVERAVTVALGLVGLAAVLVAVAPAGLASEPTVVTDGRLLAVASVVVTVTGIAVLAAHRWRSRT